MRVEIWPSCQEVGKRAAGMIRRKLQRDPHAVFALPTGTTPLAVYAQLAAWHARSDLDAARAAFFGLDEFVGLDPAHAASFRQYLRTHLWDPLGIDESRRDLPRGWVDDLAAECLRYDRAIADAGGIDLAVVGIGVNGHVGF
ncbi:MAG: 6-phosphogluconolactonase, partial [Bacillota bacterium]|nr:6-phosphogluconolactonase [Bacillota bacterium]